MCNGTFPGFPVDREQQQLARERPDAFAQTVLVRRYEACKNGGAIHFFQVPRDDDLGLDLGTKSPAEDWPRYGNHPVFRAFNLLGLTESLILILEDEPRVNV